MYLVSSHSVWYKWMKRRHHWYYFVRTFTITIFTEVNEVILNDKKETPCFFYYLPTCIHALIHMTPPFFFSFFWAFLHSLLFSHCWIVERKERAAVEGGFPDCPVTQPSPCTGLITLCRLPLSPHDTSPFSSLCHRLLCSAALCPW